MPHASRGKKIGIAAIIPNLSSAVVAFSIPSHIVTQVWTNLRLLREIQEHRSLVKYYQGLSLSFYICQSCHPNTLNISAQPARPINPSRSLPNARESDFLYTTKTPLCADAYSKVMRALTGPSTLTQKRYILCTHLRRSASFLCRKRHLWRGSSFVIRGILLRRPGNMATDGVPVWMLVCLTRVSRCGDKQFCW